jgi:excisionase family DNA binding protein
MARVSTEARIERRGPASADRTDASSRLADPEDVFDHLAHCSRLLTAKELAALLGISPKTIYGYVARNLIPHYKITTSVRFRARDIAEWLRSHAA